MKTKDIFYYIQGNIRYQLFYSTFAELIPTHIREQIIARVDSMDDKCYRDGQCKLCGCKTTALQMCNKACDKPCYPEMLNRKQWRIAKAHGKYIDKKNKNLWSVKPNRKGNIIFKLYAK